MSNNSTTTIACDTLFDVLFQPYWLILITLIGNIILSILIKIIFYQYESRKDPKRIKTFDELFEDLIEPSLVLLLPQSLLQIAHFGYAIYFTSTSSNHYTPWNHYQAIGVMIMNSGFLNNLSQCIFYLLIYLGGPRHNPKKTIYASILVGSQGLIIVSFVLTHTLPAIFLYFWMCVILLIPVPFWYLAIWSGERKFAAPEDSRAKKIWDAVTNFAYYFFWRLLILALIIITQSGFNYSVLFYNRTSYLAVISNEYMLRKTHCYLQEVLTTSQHKFSLITYIL